MRYYCELCLNDIKQESKHCHLKSKSHKEIEDYRLIILSLKNVDSKMLMIYYIYT